MKLFANEMNHLKRLLEEKSVDGHAKIWIYKDKVLVLDFNYKDIRFAFDIENSHETYTVHILNRNMRQKIPGFKDRRTLLGRFMDFDGVIKAVNEKIDEVTQCIDLMVQYDVTVVIPVYNREDLIERAIYCLNNQTIPRHKFEVIFVDDCSSDHSVIRIKELMSSTVNYSIVLRSVGSGNASIPRNEGIKAARGRYIFFLDSDDFMENDTLERAVDLAYKNNSDLVYAKIGAIEESRTVPIRPYKYGTIDKADVCNNHLFRSLSVFKLFRKSLLINNKILFNPSIANAEDKIFMCQVLAVANVVSILADKVYCHVSLHEGEHLSRGEFSLQDKLFILVNGFLHIFGSPKNHWDKSKLYNAWLIILLEFTIKIIGNKKISYHEKNQFFSTTYSIAKLGFSLLDEQQLYKEVAWILPSFTRGDFKALQSAIESRGV